MKSQHIYTTTFLATTAVFTAAYVMMAQGTVIDSTSFKDAGNYYADVSGAKTNYLGAAQGFHIFAREVSIIAHTNGNIATQYLKVANANWGTNVKPDNAHIGTEISYIQAFDAISGNPFVAGHQNKLVFGWQTQFSQMNNAEFFIQSPTMANAVKLNDINRENVYSIIHLEQEGNNPYIDFDGEYEKLYAKSLALSTLPESKNVVKSISNRNNRTIDLTNASVDDGYVYITLSEADLKVDTPITIIGLEKQPFVKDVIIIVDAARNTTVQSNAQIKIKYADGSERSPQET